jgi:hypothetical protein
LIPGATCLDERRLEAQVRTWLGKAPIPSNVRVVVRGDDQNPQAVEFRIARQGDIRWRRFDPIPARCDEAHAALGLSIALAIDAGALENLADWQFEEPRLRLVAFELLAGRAVTPG